MTPLTKETSLGTLTVALDESGRHVAYSLDTKGKTVLPVCSVKVEDWPRHLRQYGFSEQDIAEVVMASIELYNAHKRNQWRRRPKNGDRTP